MIKFINKLTGGEMWVADDRVEEYKAAGHKLTAVPVSEKETRIEAEGEEDEVTQEAEYGIRNS